VKRFKGVLAFLTLALAVGTPGLARAQGLTGQIGGSVVDVSKGAIPGATVTLRNTATAATRDATTDNAGLFVFTNVFAGTYDLRVTLTGFRTYEQKGVVVTATERLALAPMTLEVGGVEEVVTVEASALHAQAQSGERSGTIRADEIKDTQLRGRDFLGLLQGMPGVVDTNVRNAPGWNAFLGTQINGLSDQFMGLSYDGVSSKDTGFGAANYVTPSLDSISEVKIQTSNYQAEYGRAGGANIIVVTKSGSSQFHGSAAYFKRHEALTENTWDRRRTCDATGGTSPLCAKPRYRYDNSAFTLGGPVIIPGLTFNENRDKLFFFYSLDLLPRTDPFLVSSTMPSALERNGDFSQTRNFAGQLRFIRNPFSGLPCNVNTGGAGCFPGNVIPQSMINPMGRQIMNLFPLPDPALVGNPVTQGNYNYQFAGDTEKLRRDNVIRVDWNVGRKTTFYTRVLRPGQLAHKPERHARPRRPLLAHRRRLRPESGHRMVRSGRVESRESDETVAAALRERRVSVHRSESRCAQPRDRGNASEPVDRGGHRRLGRHQQRNGLRERDPRHVPECRHQDRTTPRVRLGPVRQRQDGGSRRIRDELQPARRRPIRRVHRCDQPNREPAMDDHRRSLQYPVAGEPSERDDGPGRDPADHGAFLERRRAA
jgi:hypothetical protein